MKKPNILITNDDGIYAEGIKHLWETLLPHFDLTIIAPSEERSAVGLGVTIRDPLQIQTVAWEGKTRAWKVTGTPADCVRMAMSVILDTPPDLIVSGINRGSNAGRNVLYSGTVGGVIEGVFRNIPGIAFSCVRQESPNYKEAGQWIPSLVRHCLEHPLPKGTLLNVNFPDTPTIQGVRLAKQGQGFWIEEPDKRLHPEGHAYYWLGGKWHDLEEEAESDVQLLKEGFAAAVPIHVGELTDLAHFHAHKEHFNRSLA